MHAYMHARTHTHTQPFYGHLAIITTTTTTTTTVSWPFA